MKNTDFQNKQDQELESKANAQVSRRNILKRAGQSFLGMGALALLGNGNVANAAGRSPLERMLPGTREIPQPFSAAGAVAFADGGAPPTLAFTPNLPMWGDGQNFNRPEYYETLCVGDVDGDGQDELIIRGPAGILVERFDPPSGQWVTLTTAGPAFSDVSGWDQEHYYRTIQCADIDGDGKDEIIARGTYGIVAYSFDTVLGTDTSLTFVELPAGPAWSDTDQDGIWLQESHYSNILCGKLQGGKQSYLLARGTSGIVTWAYDKVNRVWYYEPGVLKLADAAADSEDGVTAWNLPQYYETLQLADIDGDGKEELIGRAVNGLQIWKMASNGHWDHIYGGDQTPMSDAAGWDKPYYYQTIQCADIDGDGQKEILARAAGGIVAYGYKKETGSLGFMLSGPAWADGTKWDSAPCYSTIRFGDIDGDGFDEMIGRDENGIQIYKYYPIYANNQPSWIQLSWATGSNPKWDDNGTSTDANSTKWDEVQYYSTIRFVRTHADEETRRFFNGNAAPVYNPSGQKYTGPYAALVARDRFGIQTWRYRPADFRAPNYGGYFQSAGATMPDFSTDPGTEAAYVALDQALRGTDATGRIRDIYNDTENNLDAVDGFMSKLYDSPTDMLNQNQVCKLATPTNINYNDWQDVTWQIYWEMAYVSKVNKWFRDMNDYQNTIAIGKGGVISTIGGYMNIPSNSKTALVTSIFSLVFNGAWAVLGFPGIAAETELAALPGQLSAIAGMLSTGFSAAALAAGSDGGSWQGVYAQFEEDLTNAFVETQNTLGTLNLAITGGRYTYSSSAPMNYGLLVAIGKQLQHVGTYNPWGFPTDRGPSEAAAQRIYALQVWQAIIPAAGWCIGYASDGTVKSPDWPYHYANNKYNPYWLASKPPTLTGNPNYAPNQDQLFLAPSNESDTFPLNVPIADVFEARNGWPALNKYDFKAHSDVPPIGMVAPNPSPGVDIRIVPELKRNGITGAIEATLLMENRGATAATNMEIVAAQLGALNAVEPLPHRRTRIAGAREWKAVLKFPINAAQSGQTVVLRIKGQHKNGTFGGSYRVKLP